MSNSELPEGVDSETVKRAMRRVLEAEEEKLHMDLPRGIINEIEQIIREEVD
jgi:hypothetical protein